MLTVVIYPKCSTCKNAVLWLEEMNVKFKVRHIVEEALSSKEIAKIHEGSGLPLKNFFNTSGVLYKELGLKNKINEMTEFECYDLLGNNGMLVKRPLIYDGKGKVTLGFNKEVYEKTWK